VVDCEDCQEPHYFGWDLLHGNLRHLLDLDLRGGRVLDDAAFGRWSRRADALGGHATLSHARVRLLLPDDLPRPTGCPA